MINYKPPQDCVLKVKPVQRENGFYCLYHVLDGVCFGMQTASLTEIIDRADRENKRYASYKNRPALSARTKEKVV